MNIHISRRYVTLLELLIVIAVLALVGGLTTIGINKALTNQRFRTEVSLVVDQLRLAQDLMLILGTDVRVIFIQVSGKGIEIKLEMETKISPEIERELLRRHGFLKTIKGVFFGDKDSEPGKIAIKFQSMGAVMSKGLMRLATSSEDEPPARTLQSYICLSGYPRHIFSEDDMEKAKAGCATAIESVNDPALTQDTFSKIPDLFKPEEKASAGEGQKKKPDFEEDKSSGQKKGVPSK